MTALTDQQEAVRDFIASELGAGHPCPSQREIAAHFGFASSYAAACHVRALVKKGELVAAPGKARSLRLAGANGRGTRSRVASIPLFGSIPAGFGREREQEAEGCVSVDIESLGCRPTRNTFALRV